MSSRFPDNNILTIHKNESLSATEIVLWTQMLGSLFFSTQPECILASVVVCFEDLKESLD